MAALNRQIHGLIASSAHNRFLLRALSTIADTMILLPTTLSDEARARAAHEEHLAIVEAIEARDREGAERAAREHMRAAQKFRVMKLMT
jgi:DNA-binding GntR family transcriptional regulator